MIRVTVPRPVADALLPTICQRCWNGGGINRGRVRNPAELGPGMRINTVSWVECPACDGSGSLPPPLTWLVVDPEPEAVCDCPPPWADCMHPPRPVCPADLVRAIESGERIGIDVWCAVEHTVRHHIAHDGSVSPTAWCSGRVPVGSVRPVRVLPVVGYMRGRVPDAPCIEVVTASYVREWYECPPDATHDRIMHRMVDLSLYGPAESLVGKFAVEVEDARREP